MASRAATIAALRAHLAQVAPVRTATAPHPTGIPELDAQIGGWPHPGVAAIHGPVGTGRLGLILPALQAHTASERTIAIVDPMGWLYPPGLPDLDLRHLMLVRPGATRAGWATVQLAGSGAMPLVVLLDPPPLGRDGLRLLRATEAGHSTVVVLTERADPKLVASVRLAMIGGGCVRIERGAVGQPVIEGVQTPPWTGGTGTHR